MRVRPAAVVLPWVVLSGIRPSVRVHSFGRLVELVCCVAWDGRRACGPCRRNRSGIPRLKPYCLGL